MKFIISALALIGFVSAAPSVELFSKRAATCSADTLSCHTTGTVDSCCSPTNGLVVLDLQWAPGWGPADEFTIHGLWPDTCTGGLLSSNGCDSTRSSTTIATAINNADPALYNRMSTYWPSNTGDNNYFWSHEWTKHGTCVTTYAPACYGSSYVKNQDVVDYFTKVCDLRDKYDIFGALNKNGISVGGTYNVETIRSAIKSVYGAKAKLDCTSGTLTEVSLNFYVRGKDNYEITDVLSAGTCSGAVYFPKK